MMALRILNDAFGLSKEKEWVMELALNARLAGCGQYLPTCEQFAHIKTIYSLIQALAKGAVFFDFESGNQTVVSIFQQHLSNWEPGQVIEIDTSKERYRLYDDPASGVVIEVLNEKDQIMHSDKVAGASLLICWSNLTGDNAQTQFLMGVKCLRRLGWDNAGDAHKLFSLAAAQDHVLATCYQTLVEMKRCARHFGQGLELSSWITFDAHEVTSYLSSNRRSCSYLDIDACYNKIFSLMSKHCVQAEYIFAWILINKSETQSRKEWARDIFDNTMKKCAEKGYAPAQFQIAQSLHKSGDEQGRQQWLELTAQQNYAPACYQFSALLKTCNGRQAEADSYREVAIKQGYPPVIREIIEANNTFRNHAAHGGLYSWWANELIQLPVLPDDVAAKICSYNTPSLMRIEAANTTWLDEMLESICWDVTIDIHPQKSR